MPLARARFEAGMQLLRKQETVDAGQMAAIGYCFGGGGVVLNMARIGVNLRGVVSFYGALGTDNPAQPGKVKARIISFTGEDDAMITAAMGVEPFLLSSSLLGVLAQRLVRCLCTECREGYAPDSTELALLEGELTQVLYRPKGCVGCGHSGYRRRIGIYELLRVDDDLRRLIHDRVSEQSLREYAVQRGTHGLRQDGIRLVISGMTSLEELLRVTRE